jgi:hypothetical protein
VNVDNLKISVGRTINLGNSEVRSLEIGMTITLKEGENIEQHYHSLRNSLEKQLDSWEHETRLKCSGASFEEIISPPPLIPATESLSRSNNPSTISQVVTHAPEPVFKSKYKEETIINPEKSVHSVKKENLICPVCKEPMFQKKGKEYYLCTKHWGYPNQIARGIVKERKF